MPIGTLALMKARILFELGQRTDLSATAIPDAINDAITIYQKERFRFNEIQPLSPFQFNTIAGVAYYDSSVDARIGQIFKIDYVNTIIGSTVEKMDRVMPESIYLALQTGTESGQPLSWAYDGQSIVLYPRPDIAYPLIVGGYLPVAAPATDAEANNPWMNAAERLIRSRAKYEIALHVTRNKDMQLAMSPESPQPNVPGYAAYWAYMELKGEANKITGTSRIRAMRF